MSHLFQKDIPKSTFVFKNVKNRSKERKRKNMEINKYIDHTLLKQDATEVEIDQLCVEAKEYDFMSVCVNSSYVKRCVDNLKNTDVKVCSVIGFPLGMMT